MKKFMVPGRCEESYQIDPKQRQKRLISKHLSPQQLREIINKEPTWATNCAKKKNKKEEQNKPWRLFPNA